MKKSVEAFQQQMTGVVVRASEDGSCAFAIYRYVGKYLGDGRGFMVKLSSDAQVYNLTGYDFFQIKDDQITEIKAFFDESDIKQQIVGDMHSCGW